MRSGVRRAHALGMLLASLCLSVPAFAGDSELASAYWTSVGAGGERWSTVAEAVSASCQKLRQSPPGLATAESRVVHCAERPGSIGANRVRIDYTLETNDRSLGIQSRTDSELTLQRRAHCPNRELPYLRDSEDTRQLPSCWRCPAADLQAQAPRFLGENRVRWYRRNQCPIDLQPAAASVKRKRPPLATGLAENDDVGFRLLRDAGHGRIGELRFADGRSLLLIGGGEPDAVLTSLDAASGSLRLQQGQWCWQRPDGSEYRFAGDSQVFQPAQEKRLADGRRWQFSWQSLASPDPDATPRFRLLTMRDPGGQNYEYRYDRAGKLATLTVQRADHAGRLAVNRSNPPEKRE